MSHRCGDPSRRRKTPTRRLDLAAASASSCKRRGQCRPCYNISLIPLYQHQTLSRPGLAGNGEEDDEPGEKARSAQLDVQQVQRSASVLFAMKTAGRTNDSRAQFLAGWAIATCTTGVTVMPISSSLFAPRIRPYSRPLAHTRAGRRLHCSPSCLHTSPSASQPLACLPIPFHAAVDAAAVSLSVLRSILSLNADSPIQLLE